MALFAGVLAILAVTSAAQATVIQVQRGMRRPGDPLRVGAGNLNEYRHLQFFNDEYKKWVKDNIHPIEYANNTGVLEIGWDDVRSKAAAGEPEVVMVTQSTTSRLASLRLVMREWDGPVAVAMFIEYLSHTDEAQDCTRKVVDDLQEALDTLWPPPATPPPLSVSFLYTAVPDSDAACKFPAVTPQTSRRRTAAAGGSKGGEARLWPFGSWGPGSGSGILWQPGNNGRRLQGAMFDNTDSWVTDPGGGPAIKAAWHYWPRVRRDSLRAPEQPWQVVYDSFYPVNALRNLAWSQVPSGAFVFLNDVDFLPTPTLHADLVHGKWQEELRRMRAAFYEDGERHTLVLPAFERLAKPGSRKGNPQATPWRGPCRGGEGCEEINGMALPRSFEMLRTMIQYETIIDVFHRRKFFNGHGCYSWFTWLQTETPKRMIGMEYSNPCEPYVIALNDAMPRYDERFRGRGQNKVEQLTHMAMWGFRWRLLPGHFVLHVPHAATAASLRAPSADWDEATMPLVLTKIKIEEVKEEPEFRHHVVQAVPVPVT